MKFIFSLLVLSCICVTANAQSDLLQSKSVKDIEALKKRREYEAKSKQVKQNSPASDMLSKLSSNKFKIVGEYSIRSKEIYTNTDLIQQNIVNKMINNELFLKTNLADSLVDILDDNPNHYDAYLSDLPTSFGTPQPFKINAQFVSGGSPQRCRLYWANYLGGDRMKVITNNIYDGNSDLVQSPYQIELKLPGYITFWLVDLTTQKIYKSDFSFKRITKERSLDVIFLPVSQ